MNYCKRAPFLWGYVVDHNLWLWKKAHKTLFNSEFFCRIFGVVAAATTPAIQYPSVFFHFPDVRNRANHRNALSSDGSNKRIINIYVGDLGHFILPNALDQTFRAVAHKAAPPRL
jgi:hypothetical protein